MTAVLDPRHPAEDDPTFLSETACYSCGSLTAICTDPGCLSWGITVDKLQDRREDY